MKIAFMGTPDFAVPSLNALLDSGHEVVAVVAQPSRPAGRGQQVVDPPTVVAARARGVPVFQPKAVRSGPFPEKWKSLDLDLAVVAAYGRILTPELLHAPRLGCVNVHASLLPKYRGAAPIQWAVAHGETEAGVTLMKMDEGLDTGDMLVSRSTPIGPEETAEALTDRLAVIGAELLIEHLDHITDLVPTPQDHAASTLAPLLVREDGRIVWTRSAREISCQVRGMTPWPGSFARFRGAEIRICQARPVPFDVADAVPGTVLVGRRCLVVATGEGAVELCAIQCPNRKRQTGCEMVNGSRVQVGEVFE